MDQKRIEEIRSVLSGLRVPVEQKLQAWVDYGKMLLECPFKQGAQIGNWVREQGLDFVEANRDRAEAKKLAELTFGNSGMLNDCPHSHPSDAMKWLRKTGQIESKPRKPSTPKEPKPQAEPTEQAPTISVADVLASPEPIVIQREFNHEARDKWVTDLHKYTVSSKFYKALNNSIGTLNTAYGIPATEEDVAQLAQLYADFVSQIDADPLLLAVVFQHLGTNSFHMAKKVSQKPT